MKKWLVWGGVGVALVTIAVVVAVMLWPRAYELSAEYYGKNEIETIDATQLKALVNEKKSFALLIYQPSCRASEDFEEIVEKFIGEEQVGFEKITFSEAKDSGLIDGLKYYPSVALYRNGELRAFLKTDEDADLSAYQSLNGFTQWWKKYIKKKS